ncbi:MAG: hypothetical protein PF442_09510 [Desulfobulbaceae bacterium]|jgi:ABC-type antimicrobial peptide transport system permease subunit|nr:hypothetical protein [Desulfobulbaceae bacterium]
MVTYLEQVVFVRDYVALQMVILFVLYGGIAVLISLLLGKIVTRFAHFTSSDLDDKIIDPLQSPVSWTIIGVAFILSLADLDIQDYSAQLFNRVCLSVIQLGCRP